MDPHEERTAEVLRSRYGEPPKETSPVTAAARYQIDERPSYSVPFWLTGGGFDPRPPGLGIEFMDDKKKCADCGRGCRWLFNYGSFLFWRRCWACWTISERGLVEEFRRKIWPRPEVYTTGKWNINANCIKCHHGLLTWRGRRAADRWRIHTVIRHFRNCRGELGPRTTK